MAFGYARFSYGTCFVLPIVIWENAFAVLFKLGCNAGILFLGFGLCESYPSDARFPALLPQALHASA